MAAVPSASDTLPTLARWKSGDYIRVDLTAVESEAFSTVILAIAEKLLAIAKSEDPQQIVKDIAFIDSTDELFSLIPPVRPPNGCLSFNLDSSLFDLLVRTASEIVRSSSIIEECSQITRLIIALCRHRMQLEAASKGLAQACTPAMEEVD